YTRHVDSPTRSSRRVHFLTIAELFSRRAALHLSEYGPPVLRQACVQSVHADFTVRHKPRIRRPWPLSRSARCRRRGSVLEPARTGAPRPACPPPCRPQPATPGTSRPPAGRHRRSSCCKLGLEPVGGPVLLR